MANRRTTIGRTTIEGASSRSAAELADENSGVALAGPMLAVETESRTTVQEWWHAQRLRLRRDLISIANQVRLLSLLMKRREVPWPAKVAGGCAIAYIFSPIQLIPTFIPVVGQLDDLVVLFLGTRVVRRFTPVSVLRECEKLAESASSAQIARWEHILRNSEQNYSSAA